MILIIYDSVFGNTEKVALALSDALIAAGHQAMALKVSKVKPEEIEKAAVIVIGSPTHVFRVSEPMEAFLKENLKRFTGHKVAIFDTRASLSLMKSRIFHTMAKRFGYAADFLAKKMKLAKAKQVAPPMPFTVLGGHGPLADSTNDDIIVFAKKIAQADL